MNHIFTNEELRDIILSKTRFAKCVQCDNDGQVWYDGATGLSITGATEEEYIVSEDCNICNGLAYVYKDEFEI